MRSVTKVYKQANRELKVLKNIDILINKGEFIAVTGTSGSGKSTLMGIMGLLESNYSGEYYFCGRNVHLLSEQELAALRNRQIGFVFQSFHLIPKLSAVSNVEIPLFYMGLPQHTRHEMACNALEELGLGNRMEHLPSQLSGGQRQRVAIARALVTNPSVIMADEPTGNLDSRTGKEIIDLLRSLKEKGTTIVLITHDKSIAECADKVCTICDGELVGEMHA